MSYDLILQPRGDGATLPSVASTAKVLTEAGAIRVDGDASRFQLPDSCGDVDVDVVATPEGVSRVEIASNSGGTSGLYEFTAWVAERLNWDVYDPQGGETLGLADLRRAAHLAEGSEASPGIGPRTFLSAHFFLPVVFVWFYKGASPRSVLFPIVIVLGVLTVLSMAWDRMSRRGT